MRPAIWLVLGACSFHRGSAATTVDDGPADSPRDAARSDSSDSATGVAWRMPLAITNRASVALGVGFQIGFTVDLDGAPCAGDRATVHVWRGTTDITRTIDELGTGNEWIWFPLQAAIADGASSNEYSLSCLDPAGTAPSDPAQVFDFVEPFANLTAWTTRSNPTVSGGVVTLPSTDAMILSTATYSADHAMDVWFLVADPMTNDVWAGWQDQAADAIPWLIWYTFSNQNKIYPAFCDSNPGCPNGPLAGAPLEPLDNAWHLYGVENCGNATAQWRLSNVVVFSAALSNYTGSHRLRVDNYNTAATVQAKGVRVRKAACPAPTVTVGAATMQ